MEYDYFGQASEATDQCASKMLELIESNDNWKDLGEKEGVKGSLKITPEGKFLFRSIGVLEYSCSRISKFLKDGEKRKMWESILEESCILKAFDNDFRIMYESFYAPWPVRHRDFVFACKAFKMDDGLLIVSKSMEAGIENKKNVIRGEIIAAGFYLKTIKSRKTEVTYLACVDPKGSLPKFIVKEAGKRQCFTVNKVRVAMNAIKDMKA